VLELEGLPSRTEILGFLLTKAQMKVCKPMKVIDKLDFWFSIQQQFLVIIGVFFVMGLGILFFAPRTNLQFRKLGKGFTFLSGSMMLLLASVFFINASAIKRGVVHEYWGQIVSINRYNKLKGIYHENFQLDTVKNHLFSCEMECDMNFHLYQNNVRVPANPLQIGIRVKVIESNSRQIVRLEVIER
jgi:hypothetical protein